MNLVWFRNDLRVYDNPALSASMAEGDSVAVYCLTQKQWDSHGDALAKRSLIVRQLRDLERSLAALNVPLMILDCQDFKGIESALASFSVEKGINKVFFNHDYGVNERNCAFRLEDRLAGARIEMQGFHDQCIVEPGLIRTNSGACFQVFSAFKRAFISKFKPLARPLWNKPEPQASMPWPSDLSALEQVTISTDHDARWLAGEDEAHERLTRFIENSVFHYSDQRDHPFLDSTSRISPYLTIGALSTSQCLRAVLGLNHGHLADGNKGVVTWINELIWREFYRHLLFSYPELSRHRPFKESTDQLPWRHDEEAFKKWREGATGFPLVDAAMRQLKAEAWMHNRLRMVTAMFLTKHLFIDWRLGEQYFMETLVDGDLASNNGGWQWSASTGVDAVPYFRIFNPTRQSERFDESGDFIRYFVPELASLDNKSIHNPTAEQRIALGYPPPMVDHKEACANTKALFQALSRSAEHDETRQNDE